MLRDDLTDWERLAAEDADRQLTTGDELLDHDLVIVFEGLRDRRRQIDLLLHDRQADRRTLLRWLDDHRPAECTLHLGRTRRRRAISRHQPVCRSDAVCPEEMLRQILVHRQRARQMTAAGIRNSRKVE